MKPKNFPARRLLRQLKAKGEDVSTPKNKRLLEMARNIRTKKDRSTR